MGGLRSPRKRLGGTDCFFSKEKKSSERFHSIAKEQQLMLLMGCTLTKIMMVNEVVRDTGVSRNRGET